LQFFKRVTDVSRAGDPFDFFYRVLKVVSQEEMEIAEQHVRNAGVYLDNYAADGDAESLGRAEKELLRAVELFPGCSEGHAKLANVYLQKGEDNRAKQESQRWKQIHADRRSSSELD
jgi:hypothetical protein